MKKKNQLHKKLMMIVMEASNQLGFNFFYYSKGYGHYTFTFQYTLETRGSTFPLPGLRQTMNAKL